MRDLNKFKGCLIGGAVGDALGYAVEFMPDHAILEKYGNNGITEYELHNGIAEISDDTQMTMFTANGLLLGTTRGKLRGIMGPYSGYIAHCYGDWLRTQTEKFPLAEEFHYSWLVNVPELFSQRAPGKTCISAIRQGACGTMEEPVNNSKGCGGIMRVAPIGLYFNDRRQTIQYVDRLGAEAAALTHGHELGYLPAAAFVHIIQRVSGYGDTILEAVQDMLDVIPTIFPNGEYLEKLMGLVYKATGLSQLGINDSEAIRQLGEGWVAEETLAIAVYCALKYSNNFEKGIIASVNHSGDSDSTGAVTGNILGASLGYGAIPEKFTERLELKEIIIELAEDLFYDCQISEYGHGDKVWESKYVDMTYRPNKKVK